MAYFDDKSVESGTERSPFAYSCFSVEYTMVKADYLTDMLFVCRVWCIRFNVCIGYTMYDVCVVSVCGYTVSRFFYMSGIVNHL